MFCIHLKPKRIHVLFVLMCLFSFSGVVLLTAVSPAMVPASTEVRFSGKTAEDRIGFIENFGWEVEEDPVSVEDVVIPSQFGDVYENYNRLQIRQGFDLQPYAGRMVKKWTYAITNYPGYADSAVFVRVTLLVCQGMIIGGDVCSVELDGFMHGFAYETAIG